MLRRDVALAVALVVLMISSATAITVAPGRHGTLPIAATAASAAKVISDALPVPVGRAAAPLPESSQVWVTLSLAGSDPDGLASFLTSVEDPGSPQYHQFLTEPQFVARFAPSAGAVSTVLSTLASYGGRSVSVSPDRSIVSVSLTPAAVHALFGVELVQYGVEGNDPLYTAVGNLTLPPSWQGLVSSVTGLADASSPGLTDDLLASPLHPLRSSAGANDFVTYSGSEWFVGSDYTQEFGASDLFPSTSGHVAGATFPTKVAVATLLAGGFNQSTGTNLPSYDPTVVRAYFNGTFPAAWPQPNVSGMPETVDGVAPPPPGSFGSLNDSTGDEFENSLDVEMAGSLAPGAAVVNFYFAGSLLAENPSDASLADDFAQILSNALAHNYSPARLAVVSGSFGLPDLNDSAWNFETAEAAAMGVTLTIASGDQGNAPDQDTGRSDGPNPTWPGSADFNTSGSIAVGGVSLTVGGTPTSNYTNGALNLTYDANMTGITGVAAWYQTAGAVIAGTEGGVSPNYPEPYWQNHSAAQPAIRNATLTQGATSLGRAEPDLALPANDTIATVWANATEGVYFTVLAGTSIGAPVLAGLLADIVAVESNRSGGWDPLGFFAPEIYRIASYYAANPGGADPFSSVTTGRNYLFTASVGWDALTGWGIVNDTLLLAAVGTPAVANYTYTGPTPGLPPVPPPGPGPNIPWGEIYLVFGLGIVAVVVLVYFATRSRRPGPVPSIPPGVHGPPALYGPGEQGGIYPGATFLCPYCGAVRPSEPGRCPQCGAF